jgi:hypothetical protein
MKIKVKSCRRPILWYVDCIGKTFDVVYKKNIGMYQIENIGFTLYVNDCEEI